MNPNQSPTHSAAVPRLNFSLVNLWTIPDIHLSQLSNYKSVAMPVSQFLDISFRGWITRDDTLYQVIPLHRPNPAFPIESFPTIMISYRKHRDHPFGFALVMPVRKPFHPTTPKPKAS
jgi:hypothetical protein